MDNKLLEKLKELGLDESLVADVRDSFEASVNEKAEIKAEILISEKKKELEDEFEKKSEDYKKEKDEELKNSLKEMEENLVTQLDDFIETEIVESIDESLLEEHAANKACAPIVRAFREIFESQFFELNTDGKKIVEEAQAETAAVKAELSEAIEKTIGLHKELEKFKKDSLISESVKELSEDLQAKVRDFFKDKTLSECEKEISTFISVLSEAVSETASRETETPVLVSEDDANPAPAENTPLLSEEAQKMKNLVDFFAKIGL